VCSSSHLHEKKVVLKVRLAALGLPAEVRARIEQVLGPRCHGGVAKVVADKYDTKVRRALWFAECSVVTDSRS
jgi:hypothetical protein